MLNKKELSDFFTEFLRLLRQQFNVSNNVPRKTLFLADSGMEVSYF